MLKKISLSFALGLALLVGGLAAPALALQIDWGTSDGVSTIEFDGAGNFEFKDGALGRDFKITSVTGGTDPTTVDRVGNISGVFSIGAITTSMPAPGLTLEQAPVTGVGTFTVIDINGVTFSADLEWNNILTLNSGGQVNFSGLVNLTNPTYVGTNTDLLAFIPLGGTAVATFQFTPAVPLTDLKSMSYSTSHSGSFAPVPEPGTMMLMGSGLLGLGLWRKFKK